ncbi:MAG: site-2 protease family protein [Planctomycetes bacterium]|nr:site-2 protease family protein [Planctomycetota bacterium]
MANNPSDAPPKLAPGADQTLQSLEFRLDPSPAEQAPASSLVQTRSWFRRWRVPLLLLVASIASMTWAGLTAWSPVEVLEKSWEQNSLFEVRRSILANWIPGLLFSLSLTAILGAHELGHYLVTRAYGIRSTPPLFIPFPISPIGTCGAVILMDGRQADRRQIFDIGIAGPIAGMFLAIPVAIAGMMLELPLWSGTGPSYIFGQPVLIQWLSEWFASATAVSMSHLGEPGIANTDMNPLLMAAWVGLLVTGLNMIPISQLDGGHVIFGLLGRRSRIFSWCVYAACVGYVVYGAIVYKQGLFVVMLLLVSLMGIPHPPSRNDDVTLGWPRQVLGWSTLLLPLLCIPLRPVTMSM